MFFRKTDLKPCSSRHRSTGSVVLSKLPSVHKPCKITWEVCNIYENLDNCGHSTWFFKGNFCCPGWYLLNIVMAENDAVDEFRSRFNFFARDIKVNFSPKLVHKPWLQVSWSPQGVISDEWILYGALEPLCLRQRIAWRLIPVLIFAWIS